MGFSNKDDHRHVIDYEADMYTGITTFHGLVRIYNSKHWWSRMFWITVSFAAMIGFFLQAESLIYFYHEKPTQTQVNFVAPADGIEFPDITICNFNPVKMSKVHEWNMTNETIEYVLMSYLQVENLYTQYTEGQIKNGSIEFENYKRQYNESTGEIFDLRYFFNQTGYSCTEMVISCMYGGMNLRNCCQYAEEIMTDIGKCFKFQSFGKDSWLNRQMISGAFYGLHMLIDVMQNESAVSHAGNVVDNFMDAGVKFYVHPEGVLPFLSSMGSAIPPGRRGFGAVTIRNISLLDKNEWGECQAEWDPNTNETIWVEKGTYHASNCEANCIANIFYRKCKDKNGNGCVPLRYQLNSSMAVCEPDDLYKCINITEMTGHPVSDTQDEWDLLAETESYWYKSCKCGVECNRMEYNVEMSYSAIPSKAALYGLSNKYHRNYSYIMDNFLVLNVYMKEITYEDHQQQKSINRVTVLSDVGGNMGMFLGMSVITLGEIFLFFVKGLWGIFHKKRREEIEERERSASTQTEEQEFVQSKKSFIKPLENSTFGGEYNTLYAAGLEADGNLPAGTQATRERAYSYGGNPNRIYHVDV